MAAYPLKKKCLLESCLVKLTLHGHNYVDLCNFPFAPGKLSSRRPISTLVNYALLWSVKQGKEDPSLAVAL